MLERGLGVEREVADRMLFSVLSKGRVTVSFEKLCCVRLDSGGPCAGRAGRCLRRSLLSFLARVQGPISRGWLSLE